MREAAIVATARTPLTKAGRGEFNLTAGGRPSHPSPSAQRSNVRASTRT